MPISKEQQALYPRDWSSITAEVRDREGNRCKTCGVPNGMTVLRPTKASGMDDVYIDPPTGAMYDAETGEKAGYCRGSEFPAGKMSRIVLTCAHLDHDVTNNGVPGDRPNLAALCQRHHLRHDLPHHMANAAKTRAKRKASGDLFA